MDMVSLKEVGAGLNETRQHRKEKHMKKFYSCGWFGIKILQFWLQAYKNGSIYRPIKKSKFAIANQIV